MMTQGVNLHTNTGMGQMDQKLASSKESFFNVMGQSLNSNTSTEPVNAIKSTNYAKQKESLINTEESDSKIPSVEGEKLPVTDVTEGKVESIEEKVTGAITKTLGISEEELMSILNELGMQITDLLNIDNLKNFVLKLNGAADASDVLMNEQLFSQFGQLIEAVSSIDLEGEFGISKEQLTETLNQTVENTQQESLDSLMALETTNLLKADKTLTKEDNEIAEPLGSQVKEAEKPDGAVKITVESEKTSDTSSQKQEHQNGQLNQDDAANKFIQNLTDTVAQKTNTITGQTVEIQQAREIVNQVVNQIKIMVKPDSTSMQLQLNPEHLGKILLSVVSKDGHLTASFTAQNQIAKEALESQMQVLKENLNSQGLKVEAVEVNISDFNFQQSNQMGDSQKQQKGSSKKRMINLNDPKYNESNLTDEEVLAAKVVGQNGGSIDYTA